MAESITYQANFSVGELSPIMGARVDLDTYYKGLKLARNVVTVPQGPLRRRFGTDYVAVLEAISDYTNVRLASFEYSASDEYLLVFIPEAIRIYQDFTLVATVVTPYTADQIIDLRYDQDLNNLIIVHPDVPPYSLVRGGDDNTWFLNLVVFKNVPSYDFVNDYNSITFTLGAVTGQNITLTASSPIFTPDFVGGTFTSIPGVAKIISYTSTTVVRVDIYVDFKVTAIPGYDAILGEPAFSATRGWPQTVAFYQSRLGFGGTASLPQGLFLSVLNDYYNFFAGLGLATSALILFLAGTRLNSIQFMLNAVSLFVFTTGGVYATPPFTTAALTPESARIDKETPTGIQENDQPLFIDNSVMYVQRNGRDITKLNYNINESSYLQSSAALTAEHLIRVPVDCSKYEHSNEDQATYAFFCNTDGTLAVLQIMQQQNIQSWTLADTFGGKFRRVVGLDDSVYFLIEREIEGQPLLYIEKLNFENFMDSQVSFTSMSPTREITGLLHLEGLTVSVLSEGNFLGKYTVSEGEIIISEPVTSAEIGLDFLLQVQLMPVNLALPSGNNIFQKKKIRITYLYLQESKGVVINDIDIANYVYGEYILGNPAPLLDGLYEIPTSYGQDWNQPIIVTQNVPGPFTVLAISYKVES